MKRILIIVMLFLSAGLFAQKPDQERPNSLRENLNSFKIGFFTKKLNLTTQEAEKFWPVYNDYQKQRNQIQEDRIAIIRDFNQNESNLSDAQLSDMGDKLVSSVTKETDLAVALHKQLKEILPPAKVIRFYQAETQYKAQLLNELQNRRPIQNMPGQRALQRQGL